MMAECLFGDGFDCRGCSPAYYHDRLAYLRKSLQYYQDLRNKADRECQEALRDIQLYRREYKL